MSNRTASILGTLAVGLGGGIVMYASQFIEPGTSPEAVQRTQLLRSLASLAVLAVAALVGYGLYDGEYVRRASGLVAAAFLASGIVGYGVGYLALVLAPPSGFTVGSHGYTALLVTIEEVVPFSLAGVAGATIGTLRGIGTD